MGGQASKSPAGVVMKTRAAYLLALELVLACCAQCLLAQTPASSKAYSEISTPGGAASAVGNVEQSASRPHDASFVIGNDDLLAINVWKEPDLSRSIPVRLDGRISLPLVGELQAAGRTPLQLEQDISSKLRSYIAQPEVTVIVQEIKSKNFNILGQVVKPGSYSLTTASTVLDAISDAGGLKEFAKQKNIYVLRHSAPSGESRIAFNYKEVIKGKKPQQNIRLEPGDTIVVP
jgi:polysaccharide biosynthesis/export protein